MHEVLLDTDILSEILRGIDPIVEANKTAYTARFSRLTLTSFSVFEILSGLRKRDAKAQLQRAMQLFAQNIEISPDSADFRLAADIAGDMLKNGYVIGIIDCFIAACAIRRGLHLATGNTKHFSQIQLVGYRLVLENWRNR